MFQKRYIMEKILNEKELFSFLRSAKFKQRQDSLTEQVVDLIPVYETIGLKSIAQKLREQFDETAHTENMVEYVNKINEVRFQINFNGREGFIAQSIATYFGCHEAADYGKYYF